MAFKKALVTGDSPAVVAQIKDTDTLQVPALVAGTNGKVGWDTSALVFLRGAEGASSTLEIASNAFSGVASGALFQATATTGMFQLHASSSPSARLIGSHDGTLTWGGETIYHTGNDGSGSTLDADLLDGQHGSYYLNWNNMSGTLPLSKGGTGASTAANARTNLGLGNLATQNTPGSHTELIFNNSGQLGASDRIRYDSVGQEFHLLPDVFGELKIVHTEQPGATNQITIQSLSEWESWDLEVDHGGQQVGIYAISGSSFRQIGLYIPGLSVILGSAGFTCNGNLVWHAGNDGSGSTLDADLLDGQHGSYYLNWNNMSGTLPLSKGGTGASTAANARTNLGLGNLATQNTPGATTQVIYNSSGTLAGNAGLTFDGNTLKAPTGQARLRSVTFNTNTTLNSSSIPQANIVLKKTTTSALTYTLASGVGVNDDTLTFINMASAGNLTIQGSGVTLYRNGVSGSIVLTPRQMVTLVRMATNAWIG